MYVLSDNSNNAEITRFEVHRGLLITQLTLLAVMKCPSNLSYHVRYDSREPENTPLFHAWLTYVRKDCKEYMKLNLNPEPSTFKSILIFLVF